MAGRTPAEAVVAFVDPLQRALSCVTDAVLNVAGGYHPASEPHAATLAGGLPVPLASSGGLLLAVTIHYRIVEAEGPRGPWKVVAAAYSYRLLATDEKESLAYHWHPAGRSSTTWPHLHLGPAGGGTGALLKAHLPTGRVALEEVLRLAVDHFGVTPSRRDWENVLAGTQESFEQWRTWPQPG